MTFQTYIRFLPIPTTGLNKRRGIRELDEPRTRPDFGNNWLAEDVNEN
ncbi:MAG: hypothetical protein KF685_10555 [Acidobacteria bacterium]|nr:hypothetical protein [Acidobacteriota bacterium]